MGISALASLDIRLAEPDDLAAILVILNEPEMDNGQALLPAHAQPRYLQFLQEPWRHILVAVSGEQLLGTLTLFVIEHLGHSGGRSALLEDVIVTSAARGQGVGRALCLEAQRVAQAKGCYKIALSSNLRRHGAHAFYESLGYSKHGYSFDLRLGS